MGGYVTLSPLPLLPVARTDAELVDAPVSGVLPVPAQHAGMGERSVQVFIPQVGVGVQVQKDHLGKACEHRLEGA